MGGWVVLSTWKFLNLDFQLCTLPSLLQFYDLARAIGKGGLTSSAKMLPPKVLAREEVSGDDDYYREDCDFDTDADDDYDDAFDDDYDDDDSFS